LSSQSISTTDSSQRSSVCIERPRRGVHMRQSLLRIKLNRVLIVGECKLQYLTFRELNGYDEDYIYNFMGSDEISTNRGSSDDSTENIGIDNIQLFRISNELLKRTIIFADESEVYEKSPHVHSSACDVVRSIIAELSLGEKNMILLLLRKLAFGDNLALVSYCPFCKEKMTQNVATTELVNSGKDSGVCSTATSLQQSDSIYQLSYDVVARDHQNGRDYMLNIRPIIVGNLQDIYDSIMGKKIDSSELSVKREVIEKIVHMNVLKSVPALPVDIYSNAKDLALAIVERIGDLDPLSNIRLSLTCPQCEKRFLEDFYPEYFVFKEIAFYHSFLEHDLNWIALHYGWTEGDITELPISRRKRYVNLINRTYSGV